MRGLFLIFSLVVTPIFSQSIFEWSADYKLTLSDFASPQTEINPELNTYSVYPGSAMDFNIHMTNAQFMFTKNFNTTVKTTFNRAAAVISAPDSATAYNLLKFAAYTFDLAELYSRKFRMELNEEKEAFSSFSFFQPIYNSLQEEMNIEHSRVAKASDLGQKAEILQFEHKKILDEIAILSDFCRECVPPKKSKKG